MSNPNAPLQHLIQALSQLCAVLALEPGSAWYGHFASCLQQARERAAGTHDHAALDALAGRVLSVYGGMGSFNDHVPRRDGRWITGMHELDRFSGQVHEAAHAVRRAAGPLHDEPLV